jgi:hypothetical protein
MSQKRRIFFLKARNVKNGKTRRVEGWGPFYDGIFASAVASDLSNRVPRWQYYVCWAWEKAQRVD